MITPSSWLNLKLKPIYSPEKFENLIENCYELELLLQKMRKIGFTHLTGYLVQRFMTLSFRVLDSYLKIARKSGLSEKQMRELQNDAFKAFSNFIDEKGRFHDITAILEAKFKNKTIDFSFPIFIAPVMAFIHSRIYDTFVKTLEQEKDRFFNSFMMNMTEKFGFFPVEEEKKPVVQELKSEGEE